MWTATPASSKYCKSTSLTMMQKSENIPVSSFCMRSMPFLYPWVLEAMAKWFRKPQIRRGEGGGRQAWPLSSAGTSHRGPSLAKPLGWSPDSQSRRWRTQKESLSRPNTNLGLVIRYTLNRGALFHPLRFCDFSWQSAQRTLAAFRTIARLAIGYWWWAGTKPLPLKMVQETFAKEIVW